MQIDALEVRIKGSSGTPYIATFSRDGDALKTTCSCPAGEKRIHCKHRLSLLAGDLSAVQGDFPPSIAEQISAMAAGTQVQLALRRLAAAEVEAKAALENVKRAKKLLDQAMHK